jgi:hypothetical protein
LIRIKDDFIYFYTNAKRKNKLQMQNYVGTNCPQVELLKNYLDWLYFLFFNSSIIGIIAKRLQYVTG